ncbi:MAG: hypothetical protein IH948_04065 [Bacteroidetes bacterium]|nr:hypothetical protein [Bacteroidota bacterium]
MNTQSDQEKWYKKPTGIYILCLVFPPVGIYQVWKNQEFTKTKKIILTVLSSIVIIVFLGGDKKNSSPSSDDYDNTCCCAYINPMLGNDVQYDRMEFEECMSKVGPGRCVDDYKCY